MNKHERRLNDLLSIADKNAPVAGARMAASIYMKNTLQAVGFNSRKTHPMMARWGKNDKALCIHAEIDAIRCFLNFYNSQDLRGTTMYIARAKADGSPGLAKPCEGCQRAIVAFGIDEVYWTK